MKKIETLTKEQEALLPAWRDKWLSHGLSTEPADRSRAEAGVKRAYEAAGLEPPKLFIWLESPLAGCHGAAMLAGLLKTSQIEAQIEDQIRAQIRAQAGDQIRPQIEAQVEAQIWAQIRDQIRAQVRAQTGAQTGAQIRAQAGAQIEAQIRAQVRDQVRAQIEAQIRAQIEAQVRAQIEAQIEAQVEAQVEAQIWAQIEAQIEAQTGAQIWVQVYKAIYGPHDSGWLSFYDYMYHVVGVSECGLLQGVSEVAQSSGWWWPFQGAVVLTERPAVLSRDAENRLHCETGPALRYPDSWSIWAWHGVRVPEWVITEPTANKIHLEPNVEIRRCAIENLGWDNYIQQAGIILSEPVPDPGNPGQLLRLSQPIDIFGSDTDELVRVLLCVNGTVERGGIRRQFGLTVSSAISDPVEAAAWSYGWPVGTYRLLQRRT